ncbi:MAG: cytochrome ubiquinol oxidase subunit I [Thermoprotei archaeon]
MTPNSVWIGFVMIGITIVSHIFLVSLVLGLAFMAPILEYLSYRNQALAGVARNALKYLAVSELAAGVWATWFTVALAGFWPQLTFIATDVLFVPLAIGITGVLIGIPFMAIYWYTWETVSKKVHIAIGAVMAMGALLVPIGFNMIFSFLDDPVGMNRALAGNALAVFQNPIYPDFTLHRISAAISMAAMVFAGVYAIKAYKSGSESHREASRFGLYLGMPALFMATATGVIYAFLLNKYSPYMASAVLGPLSTVSVSTYVRAYPGFVAFMGVVTLIWATAVFNALHAKYDFAKAISSGLMVVSSLLGVPLGEILNDYPRYPYMIVKGTSGLEAQLFINKWMYIPPSFAYAAMIVGTILMCVFTYMIYLVFSQKLPGQRPATPGVSARE